ncbi:lytic transglycosylase domain-containing protein [Burkholderia cepacia]|uniref:lytic transglycosylase domain-containing protein n=1 Tax=Burkholderia cepacia TaxID=292 RepID=UPI002ABD8515|nr:lytic transglycosylase domain-containing protein [Burkholderia cepacia]
MKHAPISVYLSICASIACIDAHAASGSTIAATDFATVAQTCAPGVHPRLMGRIGAIESGGNPFAIGVVGGRLERQPTNRAEALATVDALNAAGWNYSVGLVQVNRYNFSRYATSAADLFDPCRNLATGAAILTDCYDRAVPSAASADGAVRAALSCYYSGTFTGGRAYARKVSAAVPLAASPVVASVSTSASSSSTVTPVMTVRAHAIPVIPDVGSGAPLPIRRVAAPLRPTLTASVVPVRSRPNPEDDWFTSWSDDDTPASDRTTRREARHEENW